MRALLIGDFHGKLPVVSKSDQAKADYVIALGDYHSVSSIRKKLLKIILSGKEPKIKDVARELNIIKDDVLNDFTRIFRYLSRIGEVYFVLGNVDLICFFDEMISIAKDYNCTYLNTDTIVKIKNFNVVGLDGMPKRGNNLSWVNDRPEVVGNFNDLIEYNHLRKIFKKLHRPNIFVSHAPPYGILDRPSEDNADLFSKLYHEKNIEDIGSLSIRKILDEFHPNFHISAHTHLGGNYILGENTHITKVINVGAAVNGDYTILDTDY